MTLDALGGAMKDVAVDGMMVEEGQKYNLTGKIQGIQWTALGIAQVITGIAGGYIAEKASYRLAYMLIALFPLAIAIVVSKYKEPNSIRKPKPFFKDVKNLFHNTPFIWATLFLFCLWFSPSVGTPIFNKLREELHMTKIWIGWLDTIGAIAGVCGSLLYFKLSTKINLKRWLIIGTLFSAFSTLAYLYLTPTSVLLYNITFGVASAFIHLILMDFMARSCPKGSEATVFALLCSIVNFGTFCSNQVGARLFDTVGYNGLIIISGVFTLFCLGFVPKLKIK
jgi:predicted MFS family arabinose efflux permease